jgi:hypothetical protein
MTLAPDEFCTRFCETFPQVPNCDTTCGQEFTKEVCLDTEKFCSLLCYNRPEDTTCWSDCSYFHRVLSTRIKFFQYVIPIPFIISGYGLASHFFKKAVHELNPRKLIADLALADFGAVLLCASFANSWKPYVISTIALPIITMACRAYHQRLLREKQRIFSQKRWKSEGDLLTEPEMPATFRATQEDELCNIIRNANLDPQLVRPALNQLLTAKFTHVTDPDQFNSFKEEVRGVVSKRCKVCNNSYDFTRNPFLVTLHQCPSCVFIHCQNIRCQKAFFAHCKQFHPR